MILRNKSANKNWKIMEGMYGQKKQDVTKKKELLSLLLGNAALKAKRYSFYMQTRRSTDDICDADQKKYSNKVWNEKNLIF